MAYRIILSLITILISILSIVGIFIYNIIRAHQKWKEKVKQSPFDRQHKTKQSFIDYFSNKGYKTKTSDFIYNKTQLFLKAKDIILLPQDDLINLYERQQDEWFHVFKKWFIDIGKKYPDENILNELLKKHQKINFDFIHEMLDEHF